MKPTDDDLASTVLMHHRANDKYVHIFFSAVFASTYVLTKVMIDEGLQKGDFTFDEIYVQ